MGVGRIRGRRGLGFGRGIFGEEGRILLFSEEKRSKKDFYLLVARALAGRVAPAAQRLKKSFCFFFFRKRRIFSPLNNRRPDALHDIRNIRLGFRCRGDIRVAAGCIALGALRDAAAV